MEVFLIAHSNANAVRRVVIDEGVCNKQERTIKSMKLVGMVATMI